MNSAHEDDAIYAPGYSEQERQRLIEHSNFLGGFIRALEGVPEEELKGFEYFSISKQAVLVVGRKQG